MTALYHYCSTNSFKTIIEQNTILLSSLNLSNDSLEGRLITDIFSRISTSDGVSKESQEKLRDGVTFLEQLYDGLGFCLSEQGDLLSQWRGYAYDASGFSIGFSKEYLDSITQQDNKLAKSDFLLKKVVYSPSEQEEIVRPTYSKVKQIVDDGKLVIPGRKGLLDPRSDEELEQERKDFEIAYKTMLLTMYELLPNLYALKTAAFSEEREWRIISYMLRDGDTSCSFRALNNRLVPTRTFDLIKTNIEPIQEVILGPKNITPLYVIHKFLKQYGFKNVTVKTSSATYR